MQSAHCNDCRVHRNCRMCRGSDLNLSLVIPNNFPDNQPKKCKEGQIVGPIVRKSR